MKKKAKISVPAWWEKNGIRPIHKATSKWGDILFGERSALVDRGLLTVRTTQTIWFLQRNGLEVGRAVEFDSLFRPDGSIITQQDRLAVAAKDAEDSIPMLVNGSQALREATYGDFAKANNPRHCDFT